MNRFEVILAATLLGAATPVMGQIRASERATVTQTIDGTVITVDYGRPQLRGRVPEATGVVKVEHMWTPGANWATTVQFSRAVRVNGKPVPAGKYSLWIEPGVKTWQVHLNANPKLFHTQGPPASTMAVSFVATPVDEGLTEVLTFDFPAVSRTTASLRLRWGRATLPFLVEVEPTRPERVLTTATAAPYVGEYLVQFLGENDVWMPEMKMQIGLFDGLLRVVGEGTEPFIFDLIPIGEPHSFFLGFHGEDGRVQDVETTNPVVFVVPNGRAVSWSALAVGNGTAWVRGRRP
jgi:hypothetical protein